MNTKQQLLNLLMNQKQYISGSEIAEKLNITRSAVWKNIQQLQEQGYEIEAVRNRGYRFGGENDVPNPELIRYYLGEYKDLFEIEVRDEVSSTNSVLKEKAHDLKNWHTLLALTQTSGRGRRGRSFFSPQGSGLYLSILVRLNVAAEVATHITTAAAVAACKAIEECTAAKPGIKWVNDIYVNGKKVCGILTEASLSVESGGLDWAVMGIGFNIYEPEEGFGPELEQIAGAVSAKKEKDLKSRIAASFMKNFYDLCTNLENRTLTEEYRKRSFMKGKTIEVLRGNEKLPAVAEDIDEECRLIVRYPDGRKEALSSGEVSIKVK